MLNLISVAFTKFPNDYFISTCTSYQLLHLPHDEDIIISPEPSSSFSSSGITSTRTSQTVPVPTVPSYSGMLH